MSAPFEGARIEARGLTAAYGRNAALRGLDVRVPPGAIVAVLGENGSGKSTFLKAIARIIRPTGGEILFDGRSLAEIPRRETARRVAYVPQSADLVFPIRSLDLVLQGRAPHGRGFSADSPVDRARARDAMRACDVANLEDRDASALSGGERRRVFLARALAQEAEVWLLDEPTSGLDPRHRLDFLDILVREHRARGTTVLFVTHDVELAAGLADRVILLREGRALASGPPREALTRDSIREAFSVEARIEEAADGGQRVVLETPWRA